MTEPVTLHIPDALLDWGKDPALASRWPKPWAHNIETLMDAPRRRGRAMTDRETERLLSLVEALVVEAVRAGRLDLLDGLDLRSAEWIGLRMQVKLQDGREVVLGEGGRYTWSEVREVLAQDDQKGALAFMETCKDLLAESFPGARLVGLCRDMPPAGCFTCNQIGGALMIESDSGQTHHLRCWLDLIGKIDVTVGADGRGGAPKSRLAGKGRSRA